MSHGQPDYGMYTLARTIFRMTDMGELAARLGSIDTFDRRGDVIWFDNFEDGLAKWENTTPGGGVVTEISAEHSLRGGFSAKVYFPAAVTTNQTLGHRHPYPVAGKLGVETSFTLDDSLDYIALYFVLYDGTNLLEGVIRYNKQTQILQYMDSALTWQNIATGVYLTHDDRLFHIMKLVLDFENERYLRLILNQTSYDLSAYDLYKTASATWRHLYTYFDVANYNDEESTNYIDDLILTQNEP